VKAAPGDVGSPWAIGSSAGGHTAIEPALGTLADFRRFRETAEALEMEVALDIAFQCSPDHPYVKAHPEWFRARPDGTVQYAENPPKKYQDIYPFDFETAAWRSLWEELKSVFEFWISQDVKIFRVDNPHTKAFPFWEWCIRELKAKHPELIFLSEAFTRPRIMHKLAKIGFTQSYTYFTWRNSKQELVDYFTELTQTESREYFRPSLWPNTPDILHETLQTGGRPAFIVRVVLAATLAANYGLYGPAYELLEHAPREPGSEEYLDSEKYEVKRWELERADSLRELIARLNRVRQDNPALQRDWSLRFHAIDNPQLLVYSKKAGDPDRQIRGKECRHDEKNNQVVCNRQVSVELEPGTIARTEQLSYDPASDLISSPARTLLDRKGEMTGKSGKMEYFSNTGLMRLTDGFDIELDRGGGMSGGNAVFQYRENWVTVTQGVELRSTNGKINGGSGRADLLPGTSRPKKMIFEMGATAEAPSFTVNSDWLESDLSDTGTIEHVIGRGKVRAERKGSSNGRGGNASESDSLSGTLTGPEVEAWLENGILKIVEAREHPEFIGSSGTKLTAPRFSDTNPSSP